MQKAPTYEEEDWYTGETKVRCSDCHKVVFETEQEAIGAAEKISEREPMTHYLGSCGHWHVTRDK